MALSPGPASTVLRFLRGGCGGDCLCGRLCEPCRGQRGPDFYRGVVDRVLPEQVVLRDGRVFRRLGGSAPRPGQDVLVDDRPGLIVQTPQHQPRVGEGEPPSFVPLPPSYDTPQRPGAWGVTAFHVPKTEKGGVFSAVETAPKDEPPTRRAFVLDDGNFCVVYNTTNPDGTGADADINPALAVDHDERVVRWVQTDSIELPSPVVPRPQGWDGKDDGQDYSYIDDFWAAPRYPWPLKADGNWKSEQEVLTPQLGSDGETTLPPDFDGVHLTYDYRWTKIMLVAQHFGGQRETGVLVDHVTQRRIFYRDRLVSEPKPDERGVAFLADDGGVLGQVQQRRTLRVRGEPGLFQWPVSNAPDTGWFSLSPDIFYEGSGLMEVERTYDEGDSRYVVAWVTTSASGSAAPSDLELGNTTVWLVGSGAAQSMQRQLATYSLLPVYDRVLSLSPWIDPLPDYTSPERTILGFVADGGRVMVRYGTEEHSAWVASYSDLNDETTLTAYGRTFNRGTWTAIREPPQKDDPPDFVRVLVLVADRRAGTVTAVRPPEAATPDAPGTVETIAWNVFAREVLRCETFRFLRIGDLWHSWPPERAWATCSRVANSEDLSDYDMRAFGAHDPWRDSIKRKPKEKPGPSHWYWPSRPARRPKTLPESAPKAPLGLTLYDVAPLYSVQREEALKRGESPATSPLTATRSGQDVWRLVAKPELDDRTSTSGPLELTFAKLRDPRPPGPMFPGEQQGAALLLRLKTTADSITVDGKPTSIYRLGHNADDKRGWHEYAVPVPVRERYTLNFSGQCSRARLVARNFLKPTLKEQP
ncbi:MAG: hypothetical protein Q4C89_00840 [Deinococcus sp.]|uniref:hypothetical protein n=1 Tax=Deinococcus sp. TaxID=47478 RepID=UPI0026DDA9E4|nr:hypothetical protein [Deinococcus sp.]MDO4244555.1 hypothetical protein [Deinococcus sp.]